MASSSETKTLEDLVDTEAGSLTIANFRAYYAAYVSEQTGNMPVKYEDYLAVIESYYRNSAIAGEA